MPPDQQQSHPFFGDLAKVALEKALRNADPPREDLSAALKSLTQGAIDDEQNLPEWWSDFSSYWHTLNEQGQRLEGKELLRQFGYFLGSRATQSRKAGRGGIDPAMLLTGDDFARVLTTPPLLWGYDDKWLATADRPTLVFGSQGSGKTLLGGHLMFGALGVLGYANVLGFPVHPLADDEGVLFLAMDGPEQTKASFRRLLTDDGESAVTCAGKRLAYYPGLPAGFGAESDGLALSRAVSQVEEQVGLRIGLVIVDNSAAAWGDVSASNRGSVAYSALAQVTGAEGRQAVVITQDLKGDAQPTSQKRALASQMLQQGMGGIVSLYRRGHGKSRLRHLKGLGFDSSEFFDFDLDFETGAIVRTASDSRASTNAKDLTSILHAVEQGPRTVREIAEVVHGEHNGATKKATQRCLDSGEGKGAIVKHGNRGSAVLWGLPDHESEDAV